MTGHFDWNSRGYYKNLVSGSFWTINVTSPLPVSQTSSPQKKGNSRNSYSGNNIIVIYGLYLPHIKEKNDRLNKARSDLTGSANMRSLVGSSIPATGQPEVSVCAFDGKEVRDAYMRLDSCRWYALHVKEPYLSMAWVPVCRSRYGVCTTVSGHLYMYFIALNIAYHVHRPPPSPRTQYDWTALRKCWFRPCVACVTRLLYTETCMVSNTSS